MYVSNLPPPFCIPFSYLFPHHSVLFVFLAPPGPRPGGPSAATIFWDFQHQCHNTRSKPTHDQCNSTMGTLLWEHSAHTSLSPFYNGVSRSKTTFAFFVVVFLFSLDFLTLKNCRLLIKMLWFFFFLTQASLQKFPSSPTSYQPDQLTNFSFFCSLNIFCPLHSFLSKNTRFITRYPTANTLSNG